MNLRTKIHLASASLVLIVVFGMMGSLYISEKRALWRQIDQEQRDDLAKLSRVYAEVLYEENEVILLNYVGELVTLPKVSYAGFLKKDLNGWIYVGRNKPLLFAKSDSKDIINPILSSSELLKRDVTSPLKEPAIEMSQPIGKDAFVRLAYSTDVIQKIVNQRLGKSLQKLLLVGIIAILIGLILAHVLTTALSKPIMDLMAASKALAKGKKGITIPEGGQDELGELTRTFNHMSEELAKLDEVKDEFMSHVTHELRSPLTSIIATVELMDDMPFAKNNPKARRSIDRLKYGSERLNRLVDNILDLTRMEAGKMNFDIQPIDLGTILLEMADFFEPRALEKSLYIKAKVPKELSMAKADPEKIRQVLSNLIHNAIKFTNDGGITLSVRERGNDLYVDVKDTGVGIPKDKLKSVFEKFECLKDTRNRVNKPVPGSGLGLNIVLNSLKSQGGSIDVTSEMNKGTTFTFKLPKAKGEPKVHIDSSKSHLKNGKDPVKTRQLVMMTEVKKAQ